MSADPVMVLHTTQGHSIGSAVETMRRNRSECHEVVDPRWPNPVQRGMPLSEQLTAWANPARSLRHPPSTPQTNNRGYTVATQDLGKVYQVEIVGFAEDIRAQEDEWYMRLGAYLDHRCDLLGVPKEFPYPFDGETAYGVTGSVRLGWDQWRDVSGIIGHQHVPGNTHWDPGHLMVGKIFGTPTEGTTMDEQVAEWQRALVEAGWPLTVDGDFGPKTLAASKTVMRDSGNPALEQIGQGAVDAWGQLLKYFETGAAGSTPEPF